MDNRSGCASEKMLTTFFHGYVQNSFMSLQDHNTGDLKTIVGSLRLSKTGFEATQMFGASGAGSREEDQQKYSEKVTFRGGLWN